MKILITGVAGFIGFHVAQELLKLNSIKIYGLDNLNNYYDQNLKKLRLKILKKKKNFLFKKIDITEKKKIDNFVEKNKIKIIVHLAAQAGVRYSLSNPESYFDCNLKGFFNLLEVSKKNKVKKFIFASSSSVYGQNALKPLKENFDTNRPIQFYAATKKSNEIMAYAYSKLYNIQTIGLRFFTVYGPYGRPDMSYYKFAKNIINKKPIEIYNYGKHSRDFTYIDDVRIIFKKIFQLIKKNKIHLLVEKNNQFNVYNISSGKNINLNYMIKEIEKNLKLKSKKRYMKIQKGDVKDTLSSNRKIKKVLNIKKFTPFKKGLTQFITWFKNFYDI